jgi:DNA-binding transcriptional regulator YiaG
MLFPAQDRTSIINRIEKMSMPEPNTGCWLWLGSLKNKNGYGQIMLRNRRGKPQYAHRVSFEAFKCESAGTQFVLHSCDQPYCVNPDHLRLGSVRDNAADMMRRGRGKGQLTLHDPRMTRLSDAQVVAIRESALSANKLARTFGVSTRHICHIKRWERRMVDSRADN